MNVRIKICGITHPDDAESAIAAGADLLGLNFVPNSPRCLDLKTAAAIVERVAGRVELVGVFQNAEQEEIDRVLEHYDALVAPGRINEAPVLGQAFRSAISATAKDVMGAVGNGAGLPAVCVPNGFGARGLPTSIQFMGRAWEENAILAAARAYQSLTDWHTRHPKLG